MQWLKRIIERMSPKTRKPVAEQLDKRHGDNPNDVKPELSVPEVASHKGIGRQGDSMKHSKKPRVEYIADFPGLIDIVRDDGAPAFLIKAGDQLEIVSEVEIEGQIYFPPPNDKIAWLLPNGQDVIKAYETELERGQGANRLLFNELVDYLRGNSELPDDRFYDLNAYWIMHTYLQEKFQFSPIIWFFAIPERGKSRTGKGMIYAAYRGIIVESLREAYIIRVTKDSHATLFFDVKDLWRKAERAQSEDIILQRIEKGTRVPRVPHPELGAFKDIEYYSAFGPTLIGTNRGVDSILETRAIQINMQETTRIFENDVTEESALPLRIRLLAFRARHLDEDILQTQKLTRGRLGDITRPLFQIMRLVAPDREIDFRGLVKEIEAARLSDKSHCFEADVLLAIFSLRSDTQSSILPVKTITERINRERNDNQRVTPQKVGWTLKALGIKTSRATTSGGAAITWNEGQLRQLAAKYGITETSETSESSSIGEQLPDITDPTEVSEEIEIPF